MKHDLRVEYSGSRDKSRMGKDLTAWMERYDEYPIKHKPTCKDNTIWHYYGMLLFYIIFFGLLTLRIFI